MAETVFFQEGGVLVTSARVVAGGQTYALAGVTSTRVHVRSHRLLGSVVVLAGLFPLGLGVAVFAQTAGEAPGGLVCTALGLGIIVLGMLIGLAGSCDLYIATAGGERAALRGKRAFVERVNHAVTEAIVSRG